MAEPPRPPQEALLTGSLWRTIRREAAAMSATTFCAYLWALSRYGGGARARTVTFTALTMSQIVYALVCRSERPGLGGEGRNRYLLTCLTLSAIAQVGTIVLPPLRLILGTTPLSLLDWLVVAAASGSLVGVTEGLKYLQAPTTALAAHGGPPVRSIVAAEAGLRPALRPDTTGASQRMTG